MKNIIKINVLIVGLALVFNASNAAQGPQAVPVRPGAAKAMFMATVPVVPNEPNIY